MVAEKRRGQGKNVCLANLNGMMKSEIEDYVSLLHLISYYYT